MPPARTPTPTPFVGLTDAQRAEVERILTASVDHYDAMLTAGKKALGTTQYSDAFAGLAAMSDPKSAARRFSTWQQSSNVRNDITYLDAFGKADDYYTAENEPTDEITAWEDDMGDVQVALTKWVDSAIDWQISNVSDTELASAEQSFKDAISLARHDITKVISAS